MYVTFISGFSEHFISLDSFQNLSQEDFVLSLDGFLLSLRTDLSLITLKMFAMVSHQKNINTRWQHYRAIVSVIFSEQNKNQFNLSC